MIIVLITYILFYFNHICKFHIFTIWAVIWSLRCEIKLFCLTMMITQISTPHVNTGWLRLEQNRWSRLMILKSFIFSFDFLAFRAIHKKSVWFELHVSNEVQLSSIIASQGAKIFSDHFIRIIFLPFLSEIFGGGAGSKRGRCLTPQGPKFLTHETRYYWRRKRWNFWRKTIVFFDKIINWMAIKITLINFWVEKFRNFFSKCVSIKNGSSGALKANWIQSFRNPLI